MKGSGRLGTIEEEEEGEKKHQLSESISNTEPFFFAQGDENKPTLVCRPADSDCTAAWQEVDFGPIVRTSTWWGRCRA